MTAPTLLEVNSIAKSFRGLRVLNDVSFAVAEGALVGLIGPNGAGKSTLFNIVTGFLAADQGKVRFQGKDVSEQSVQQRCRLGIVRTFQTPKVFQQLSVLENLMIGSYIHTRSGLIGNMLRSAATDADRAIMQTGAEQALESFRLLAVRDTIAGTLPAGLQRMVELARAWVTKPRILMLDEPSSGLNTAEIELLMDKLRVLNAEGMTILLVSHDMRLVTVAAQINVLCFGEIIARGSMLSIQQDPRVREAYLGA